MQRGRLYESYRVLLVVSVVSGVVAYGFFTKLIATVFPKKKDFCCNNFFI